MLTIHPDFQCELLLAGQEKTPLIIIDNFIKDAEQLVDFCLENNVFSKVDNYYPGIRMPAPKMYVRVVYECLSELFASIFDLSKQDFSCGRSFYSLVVTPPEQLKQQQSLPHVDSYRYSDFACVHYLCDREMGGTSLYRHKKTGFERITDDRVNFYNQSVVGEGALSELQNSYMNGSNDYFDQIACVDALFNRMVIYPANVLHSGNISKDFAFDPTPSKGRLTLNSFLFSKQFN
jgi:hypothetical protein